MSATRAAIWLSVLVTAVGSIWPLCVGADELLSDQTVGSLMERLLLRKQLPSLRANDYPTFFRWYVPIRLSAVSRSAGNVPEATLNEIELLLDGFRKSANFDAKLVDYGPETNVLLIVGDDPQNDIQYFSDRIQKVSNNPNALSALMKEAQPGSIPCYRSWRFVEGVVEGAILYAPTPSQDEALSQKCIASNFAILVGLIGTPPDGDTITNINNKEIMFTKGDKAALRVLYDKAFHPNMTVEAIERTVEQVMSQ